MAGGVTVTIEGLDQLQTRVAARIEAVPEKADGIMAEIGSDAKEVMDSHTPVGKRAIKGHEPGTLKEHNTLTETEDGFELSNDAENERGQKYGGFVNYGTRKMAAQPFLDPAVEHARQEMAERLPQALEE